MNPTEEQTEIISAAVGRSDNLIINSLAGCGKTSTLEMVERAVKTKPVLYLVFNSKNAREAEERMLSTTSVRTLNSIGHRIWAKSTGRNLSLNPKKSADILRGLIDEAPKAVRGPMWESFWEVVQGVAMAKALGYLPEGYAKPSLCSQGEFHAALDETPDDLTSDLIDAVLAASIKLAYDGGIDYNDQIYMPAMFGGVFPQFPLILVDESQDLSPTNHALLRRLSQRKSNPSRVIAVGDKNQAIYQFRGSAQNGMAQLAQAYSMAPLDLSASFRCPRAIVEAARWRVPKFKWIKEGGHVETLKQLDADSIPDKVTFLCRNNAPLFRLAMQLLANGRSVSVAGSDIGPKLVNIMRKLGEGGMSRATLITYIDEWQRNKEAKDSKTARDSADCMRVFAQQGRTLDEAIAYAEHLFKAKGSIKLMTGHKAKGLEFPIVFHLDPFLIREDEQDQNLHYVMITRSEDQYYEIASSAIQW